MANINVDTEHVTEVAKTVSETYTELKNIIDEIEKKRNAIPDYWSSTEADYFSGELKKVDTLFGTFKTQYLVFMNSLANVVSTYDAQEEDFLNALNLPDNE